MCKSLQGRRLPNAGVASQRVRHLLSPLRGWRGILYASLTHGRRHGLRSFTRYDAGWEVERVTRRTFVKRGVGTASIRGLAQRSATQAICGDHKVAEFHSAPAGPRQRAGRPRYALSFRCSSSTSCSARSICRATCLGAVPPVTLRRATERSIEVATSRRSESQPGTNCAASSGDKS